MKNKIIFLSVILIFFTSCGYTPVLTKKDYLFSIKNINTISKDAKGDPAIFEMEILVEVEIKNSEKNIDTQRKFNKKISYNNKTDKFELSTYENTLIQNISENVADRILSALSNL